MNSIVALVVVLFVLLILLKLTEQLLKSRSTAATYGRRPKLFSDAERSFLGVLDQVFGTQYRIFGKVRLADVLNPRAGLSNSARASAFNRISRRHIDFVFCDAKTSEIVAAVELDDSSHNLDSRRNRDKFVDQALSSAGVPFIRFKAQRAYNPAGVRSKISEALTPRA